MIIVGNSHVSVFRSGCALEGSPLETVDIHWVGALEISHFFDEHPAAAKIRRLFEAEKGWKLLLMGNHDIFRLIELSRRYPAQQAFDFILERYERIFLELGAKGKFAWMVGLQQTKNVHFEGFAPKDIFELSRAFNRSLKEWCLASGIPVIDPLHLILDEEGSPERDLLQIDGLHLKPSSAALYFAEMRKVLGENLVFSGEVLEGAEEPKSEPESFCDLLCEELRLPWKSEQNPPPKDFEEQLLAFATARLLDRGIELSLARDSELVESGLFDSLDLVEFYTQAVDLLGTELFFDVDLREFGTVAKLAAFLLDRRGALASSASREDFRLSLAGDLAERDSVLAAEGRISALSGAIYEELKETLSIVAPGGPGYGIVYFWMALIEERLGHPAKAFRLLASSEDGKLPFPLPERRADFYREAWRSHYPREHEEWLLEVGEALCERGEQAAARAVFQRLIEQEPSSVGALNNLGVMDFQEHRLESSRAYFERALAISPDHPEALENLALLEKEPPKNGGPSVLVSAIVSTYNSEAFIRGCLEDLEAQTMADEIEIIVVDSGSQQNERAIVEEFQRSHDNIVYLRTQERETVYQAWNRGAKAASGKYLTNANTDDRHRSDAFAVLSDYLENHPEKALAYSNQLATDEPNKPFHECRILGQLTKTLYHRNIMLAGCYMGSQPMWRRALHEEIGYFDERFKSAGDYEFWCRIAQEHELGFIPQPLGVYYFNPNGVELSNLSLSLRETEQIKAMYAESLKRVPDETFREPALFRFLLPFFAEGDRGFLAEAVSAYLNAVPADAPVSLMVLAKEEAFVGEIEQLVLRSCGQAGLDPDELFADIEIVVLEAGDEESLLRHLDSADTLLAPPGLSKGLLEAARFLDLPILDQPTSEALKGRLDGWDPRAIDIVLLSHNRLKYLEQTVDALHERTEHPFRLIVVDNASEPDVLAYLEANRARFHRVVRNPENFWTPAFTQGIALTRSDPFIVSDPDILVPERNPCWLTRMVELMKLYPEMGMLALNLDPSNKPAKLEDVYLGNKSRHGAEITLSNVGTVMQTIRRRFFAPPYTTDWEAVASIRRRGGFVGFVNELVARHLGWDEERDFPEHLVKKFRHFREKHGSEVYKQYTNDAGILASMESSIASVDSGRAYYHYARPEVQGLVPRSAREILDVGCAAGSLGKALKARGDCRVTGIELSPEIAAEAQAVLDRVIVGDASEAMAGLPTGRFDCVVFADVLEHLEEPWKLLEEAKRLLSPEGLIVASVPNVRHWSVLKGLLEGRWDYQEAGILDRTHLRFFTRDSLLRLFEKAGLEVLELSGTSLEGFDVPGAVVEGLAAAGLDASTLQEEGRIYQFLLTASPTRRLTSIVILTLNQLNHTERCLDSLYEFTDQPFELILVDNGSKDGTVEYLKALAAKRANVKLILNEENRGFPSGCNQGLAASTGDYVLLLNNDTVVGAHWLGGMLEAFSDEGVGLVGPRTNYINGSQLFAPIPYHPDTLDGFDEFARRWREEHRGRWREEKRVVGFCTLISRKVIDRIGGLDEGFGSGNYEDDDYCMRALLAGFRILVAEEVFVHHSGHATFDGQKIDYTDSIEGNWRRFKKKWHLPEGRSTKDGFSPSRDILTQPFVAELHAEPLFSSGLEAAELPDRRGFNLLLADADEKMLREALKSFLTVFEEGEDVALHILAGKSLERTRQIVEEVLLELGLDPELIPDVSLLAAPETPLDLPRYLGAADAVIGSRRAVFGARALGIPALLELEVESLRALHRRIEPISLS